MTLRLARLLRGFGAGRRRQRGVGGRRGPLPDQPLRGQRQYPAVPSRGAGRGAPFTGRARDFGDVQRALEALEALYHARGYSVVTVQLPEQELNGGVVRLNVIQTRLSRVSVSGNRYFDEAEHPRRPAGLQPGQTPNLNAVSANLRWSTRTRPRRSS
jgi:hypothetical protein